MEDTMLMEFLRTHNTRNMSDQEFVRRYREFIEEDHYPKDMKHRHMPRHRSNMYSGYIDYEDDRYFFSKNMYHKFDEEEARHIVGKMYHYEEGKKCVGEKYDMAKAHEVYEQRKHSLNSDISIEDIYIAINAQYHDYYCLFRTWFGKNVDIYIIDAAITFWFKDTDYDKGHKLYNYFKES